LPPLPLLPLNNLAGLEGSIYDESLQDSESERYQAILDTGLRI
jgi:hypothetical protein